MTSHSERGDVSALVVLNPSGGTLRGDDIITADNYEDFLPTADELRTAMEWFAGAGFTVDPAGPSSFAISADGDVFASRFGTVDGPFDRSSLPEPVASLVAAVEVPEPPDFGPGNP
jgi:hypothetical protein